MKALLYCTKNKPYLVYGSEFINGSFIDKYCLTKGYSKEQVDKIWGYLNGKIVAECDFDVEEIKRINTIGDWFCYENQEEIMEKSKLDVNKFFYYLQGKNGYAIHIKNLHIFDEPRELEECEKTNILKIFNSDFDSFVDDNYYELTRVFNAPQNMMKIRDMKDYKYKILISIRPEWLCKILNGEKTIEVRKKVLKEMLKND